MSDDLHLLREHGPDAPTAAPETLAAARRRLLRGIRTDIQAALEPPAPRRRGWTAIIAVPVAAALAIAAHLLVPWSTGEDPPLTPLRPLGAIAVPVFPLSLPQASGYTLEWVTVDRDAMTAAYVSASGGRTAVTVADSRDDLGPRTIGGAELSWQWPTGEWVRVEAGDSILVYDDVAALASSLTDAPVHPPIAAIDVPPGWTVAAFNAEAIRLTAPADANYSGRARFPGDGTALPEVLISTQPPPADPAAPTPQPMQVAGQSLAVVDVPGAVSAVIDPGGAPLYVEVIGSLDSGIVVEIAASVRR